MGLVSIIIEGHGLSMKKTTSSSPWLLTNPHYCGYHWRYHHHHHHHHHHQYHQYHHHHHHHHKHHSHHSHHKHHKHHKHLIYYILHVNTKVSSFRLLNDLPSPLLLICLSCSAASDCSDLGNCWVSQMKRLTGNESGPGVRMISSKPLVHEKKTLFL